MTMQKIKVGDEVIAIAGADKGKRGTVSHIVRKVKNGKLVVRAKVEGLRLVKKHVKPNPQAGTQGGIVEQEAAISISNLALYNPKDKKPSRVGIKTLENGKKVRYYKTTGDVVEGDEG